MLSKFYEFLYLKVLVNIVVGDSTTNVYIEILNKNKVVNVAEETFDESHLSKELYQYIVSYTKESPFFYISILDNSFSQGSIPTCAKNSIDSYHDISSCEYKCYKNKWIYYTEKSDLYDIEKVYEKIGVDFIFSPFVVLANFFKDKVDSTFALFILIEDGSLSLSVFDNSELVYSDYLNISAEMQQDEFIIDDNSIDLDNQDLDDDDDIDLDDIDAMEDIDELDDFGDIADLDAIEEIDEFSEAKDIDEELYEESKEMQDETIDSDDSDSFNKDYQRFLAIQNSINNFYKDDKYKSEFIENIYIADSIGVSGDLKRYLEEEMFFNVYKRVINLPAEVCEITKMELL